MPADSSNSDAASGVPERFTRTVDLYGAAAFARIRAARVAVVGMGGVGAHAAVALARSGVGSLQLIDFDLLTESSLNRNPVAGPADVGQLKVEVMASHLRSTCPGTIVEALKGFADDESAGELLRPRPDLVIDAIDSLNPKVGLLAWCLDHDQPVLSSMGGAARTDFTRVAWADIAETRICPLARQVRRRLRRRGHASGVPCVFSTEEPAAALPPDLGDRTLDRGRIRNRLPSQIGLPAIFGHALALKALERLAEDVTKSGHLK